MVFQALQGEGLTLCLPETKVPDAGLVDFTTCN
jgi:hypothetical protein